MSEQQSIRDEMRRDVSRAVMLGAGLAKPAWTTVPVDDCEPTGEMKSVVSTDVTPFVIFVTDVILASPVIRRIQADAIRDAAMATRNAPTTDPGTAWFNNPETRWGCGHWHRNETNAIECAQDTWPFAKEET